MFDLAPSRSFAATRDRHRADGHSVAAENWGAHFAHCPFSPRLSPALAARVRSLMSAPKQASHGGAGRGAAPPEDLPPPPPFEAVAAPRPAAAAAEAKAAAKGGIKRDEYEHVLIVDRSGSMSAFNDCPGDISRWQYALECSQAFVAQCVKRQGFPMKLVLFSSKAKLFDAVTADNLQAIWEENEPFGGTNLADALKLVLDLFFMTRNQPGKKKKMIVVVITDGAPDNREDVAKVVVDASHMISEDSELGLQFIQIGRDAAASKFLQWLDVALKADDPKDPNFAKAQQLKKEVGIRLPRPAKFDILDATPSEDVEEKGGLNKVLDMAITD
jgi:uncharacterized protein YegL